MPPKKTSKTVAEPSETSEETAEETVWISSTQARLALGGVSRQRWHRLHREHAIPSREVSGFAQYDADAVESLRVDLGIGDGNDPRDRALASLQEQLDAAHEWAKEAFAIVGEAHKSEREVLGLLRAENDSMRSLRSVEQKAFLDNIIATQNALNESAARDIALRNAEHDRELNEKREQQQQEFRAESWKALTTNFGPKLWSQIQSTLAGRAPTPSAPSALTPEQIYDAALQFFLTLELSPDQANKLGQLLTPEQNAELAKLVQHGSARATAQQAEPCDSPS